MILIVLIRSIRKTEQLASYTEISKEYGTKQVTGYSLASNNDTSILNINGQHVDINNFPVSENHIGEYFDNPNKIDGEFAHEKNNGDGTVTRTYNNLDGTVTRVTGKKEGLFGSSLLGFFGLHGENIDINQGYVVENHDSNGNLISRTEHNTMGTEKTLYDTDGNKDISVGWYGGTNEEFEQFQSDGTISSGTTGVTFCVRDYNPNGSFFEERFNTGKYGALKAGISSGGVTQYFRDGDGNSLTREEYIKLNNLEE